MNLPAELEKFNLTANEVKVYLACLESGPESVQHIAAKAKLNRVTLYGIVDSLLNKGFLREEFEKNKRKIAAYPPMKLYDIVSKEKESLDRRIEKLDAIIPELKSLMKQEKNSTNIIYYEGEEGMKNWSLDALEAKGEVLEWTKIETYSSKFDTFLDQYYFPEKNRRQIPARFIFLDTPAAREYVRHRYLEPKNAPPMKARFISQNLFDTPGYMVIFNDRFSIGLPQEMRAVTVVDPIIANAQRKIFEFGWIHAKDEMRN